MGSLADRCTRSARQRLPRKVGRLGSDALDSALCRRYPLVKPKNFSAALEPIEELLSIIKLTLDFFLTPTQAYDYFCYKKRPTDPKKAYNPHDDDITYKLDDAASSADGPEFIFQINRFNVGMKELKEQGKIQENIKNMRGVPEELWTKISFQAYERTVGPRVNELKNYKAFSDQV
jgi:H3 lysine-79-specific histone-lysine N-methyltransferase